MFFHQGNYHSQVRKLVQSSLSPEVLRKLVPEIEAIAITSLESWANKQIINTFQEMKKELCITRPQCHPQLAGRNAREETATPGEFVCHRLSSSISRGRRSSAMSSCHATIATPPLPELQFAGEEAIVAVELSPPGRGKSVLCVALGESGLGFSGGVRVRRRLGNLGRRGEQRAATMADDDRTSGRVGVKERNRAAMASSPPQI
nr:abscisic acid 8'-hydroxylase 4 [Ipomoea trifida]